MGAAATDATDATGATAATVAAEGKARRLAVGASLACLAAALFIAVFPGWVMARF